MARPIAPPDVWAFFSHVKPDWHLVKGVDFKAAWDGAETAVLAVCAETVGVMNARPSWGEAPRPRGLRRFAGLPAGEWSAWATSPTATSTASPGASQQTARPS